jgi:3-oxoacyl-[acyl-carrier protein] reductase
VPIRRIVVTGGTAGIGLAVARRLWTAGHAVFICGRDGDRLAGALRSLSGHEGRRDVTGAPCDVRDLADVKSMIARAAESLGGLDGLVNSAGIAFIKDFEQIEPAMWAEIVDTNLTGVFNCCHAALPALKAAAAERRPVDIVNLGSRSGRYSFRGGVGYNATKFGLMGMTEALFLDLSPQGIRVGLVAPGTVATGLGGTAPADWHLQPDDVAHAVEAMLSADSRSSLNWVELRPARPPQ